MPQTTSVSSSRPRCFRSLSRPAIGWSTCWHRSRVVCLRGRRGRPRRRRRRAAVEDLDEAHAALDQPPRRQAHARRTAASRRGRGRRAAGSPRSPRRSCSTSGTARLHAEGQLVGLDAGAAAPGRRGTRRAASRFSRPSRSNSACCSSRETSALGRAEGERVLGSTRERHAVVLGAEVVAPWPSMPPQQSRSAAQRRRTAAGCR